MILWSLILLTVGIMLSALFSGSEMGLYRVPRVRLLIESLGGDRNSRSLLWMTNRQSLFVATTLVGNNLANYVTSLAIVMLVHHLFADYGMLPEMLAPIMLAPVLFVYGEHLPKNLFYHAPYRLLRKSTPFLFLCTILFLPFTAVLWTVSKVLEAIVGESPQRIQRRLARKELKKMFEEGHEVGILHPAQRKIAQGIFAVANQLVDEFITPISQIAAVREDMDKQEVMRLAHRLQRAELPVETSGRSRDLIGYLRVADLYLSDSDEVGPIHPLMKLREGETHIASLMLMQSAGESLAQVVDETGDTIGLVTVASLSEPLFRGGT